MSSKCLQNVGRVFPSTCGAKLARAALQAELLRVIAIATQERNYHHGHRARQVARAAHAPGDRPRAEDGRDEAGGDDDARRVRQRRE